MSTQSASSFVNQDFKTFLFNRQNDLSQLQKKTEKFDSIPKAGFRSEEFLALREDFLKFQKQWIDFEEVFRLRFKKGLENEPIIRAETQSSESCGGHGGGGGGGGDPSVISLANNKHSTNRLGPAPNMSPNGIFWGKDLVDAHNQKDGFIGHSLKEDVRADESPKNRVIPQYREFMKNSPSKNDKKVVNNKWPKDRYYDDKHPAGFNVKELSGATPASTYCKNIANGRKGHARKG